MKKLLAHQNAKTAWVSKHDELCGRKNLARKQITSNKSRRTKRRAEIVGGIPEGEQQEAVGEGIEADEADMMVTGHGNRIGRMVILLNVRSPRLLQKKHLDLCILHGKRRERQRSKLLLRLSKERKSFSTSDRLCDFALLVRDSIYSKGGDMKNNVITVFDLYTFEDSEESDGVIKNFPTKRPPSTDKVV